MKKYKRNNALVNFFRNIFGAPDSYKNLVNSFEKVDEFIAVLVFVGIVLLCLKIRKQGIETIGLRKGNIKLSLIMGITLAVILFFL